MNRTLASITLAAAAFALTMPAAHAAGPYDGRWYIDAPAANTSSPEGTERTGGCEAIRIPFEVANNQITGRLQRAPYGTGRVESGSGSSSAPISGTVHPDGTFTAKWERYQATGKFAGDTVQMSWKGECGQRTGTGGRLKQQ